MTMTQEKRAVKQYWENKVCGAVYGMDPDTGAVDLKKMAEERYRREPYLPPFADFPSARGKRMLEVGVGGGTDFHSWVTNGARATGVDLTEAGVRMTRQRLRQSGVADDAYHLTVGDAENLHFADNSFEMVYSWGVLMCAPDTPRTFCQIFRVLQPGGLFRGMIYHLYCWVALMFYVRHSLLAGHPFKSPWQAMYEHLESPGTKTYTKAETRDMLEAAGFVDIEIRTELGLGDLLNVIPRTKYKHPMYKLVWTLYPRWFVKLMGDRWGMNLMFNARKPR